MNPNEIMPNAAGISGRIGDDDFSKFLKVDQVVRRVLRFFCWLSAAATS